MAFDIVRSPGGLVFPSREVSRAVERVENRAVVKAAKVEAVGFVSQVGLLQVASLSNLEGELIKQVPLGEDRYRAIVDTATSVIAGEIAGMVW